MTEESLWGPLSTWFWNPYVWLMPGLTWDDVKPTPENGLPNTEDLFPCAIVLTICLVILRYSILEPLIIKPFGRRLGLKENTCKPPPPRPELEMILIKSRGGEIPENVLAEAAQRIGWSERQVERWLRHSRASKRSSQMFKFCDCSWQLAYYACYCLFGIYVLYDKPWFWDIKLCWSNFPFQPIPNEIWWYYMIPLGYYTNMSLTFVLQHKRKDSLQMFLHHVLTIVLIVLSFAVNMVRAGCLILVVHECADIPLLVAKLCGYAGHQGLMNFLFVVFVLLWISTRLFLFPCWILKNALFEAHLILNTMYPIYYIFNALLLLLFGFHFIWTYLIVKIIVGKIQTNETKDVRSDSEEISEDFEEETWQMNGKKNI